MAKNKGKATIIFLCTGNTCRSPMAERLFLHAIQNDEDLKDLDITSAGVSAWEGSPASDYAVKVLKDCGISLDDHRSKNVTQKLIDQAVALFCMTESHKDILEMEFNTNGTDIFLVRDFVKNSQNKNIPDPFGRSLEAYQSSRDSIVEAIPGIIQFFKEKLEKQDES